MFERRLRFLLGILGGVLLVLVLRLGQLQIVEAGYYREKTRRSQILRPRQIPFARGSVLDRHGEVLVSDEPCWNLAIDYSVIRADGSSDTEVLSAAHRRWRKKKNDLTADDEARVFRHELDLMWARLSRFSDSFRPISVEALRERALRIGSRVSRVRRIVARRRGFDAPVAEEMVAHALVSGLNASQQIAAREQFEEFPWVHVQPATIRRYADDSTALAHVLGRVGRVDATHVANDPNADDPFAKYRADEHVGITGVEWLAEKSLRGRRGQVTADRQGHVILDECVEALHGADVRLTVDAGLQRRLYAMLGETVAKVPESSGGAIVVLDVKTREVLALVSYPSYAPNEFDELFPHLRDDTDRLPLRFRAVANRYAPGSTVKPLTCLAGLMSGRIDLDYHSDCTGYLNPDNRKGWRCWQMHGTNLRKAHGSVDVTAALTGSCNIFMYRVGEMVGVDRLCNTFDMVGIGRASGIGLLEEAFGINPTPSWLMARRNRRVTPGTSRLFAIGQGELSMTPIQVANLLATYASGRFQEVTLIRDSAPRPSWKLPVRPEHWRAIRNGIYGVVNNPVGTAYKYARFQNPRFALCGKTGSATAARWPTAYRIPYVDENGKEAVAIIPAGAKKPAQDRFVASYPKATFDPATVEVVRKWPPLALPEGRRYSHAWFGGFLQPLDGSGQPDWSQESPLAFALLVEFGGSGSRTAGPLAARVAEELVATVAMDPA